MSGDSALLELFRAEAEAHMKTLSDGLLELEQDPARSQWYEPLMRAAHSIKGAAKIVGLDAAVPLAHAIEDYFVAARDGRATITPVAVDVLLAGLDALQQLTQLDAAHDPELGRATTHEISRLAAGGRAAALKPPDAAPAPAAPLSRPREPLILTAPDRLDAAWAEAHTDHVLAAIRAAAPEIRLDLGACRAIDPAGLAWLLRAARSVERSAPGAALEADGASPPVARLLVATGLARSWKLDVEAVP
jgi:two-component system sensor histidine kinase and response regulator WspE